MSFLLAAIGATVVALIESTLAPHMVIGAAGPHPVLIGAVIWTIAAGVDRGITWAFVGGLVLDSLLGRSLGTSAFSLLVVVGLAALITQPLPRLRIVVPIVAVPLLSVLYSIVVATLGAATTDGAPVRDPARLFLPGAVYDTILAIFIGPLVITLHDRRTVPERADW